MANPQGLQSQWRGGGGPFAPPELSGQDPGRTPTAAAEGRSLCSFHGPWCGECQPMTPAPSIEATRMTLERAHPCRSLQTSLQTQPWTETAPEEFGKTLWGEGEAWQGRTLRTRSEEGWSATAWLCLDQGILGKGKKTSRIISKPGWHCPFHYPDKCQQEVIVWVM